MQFPAPELVSSRRLLLVTDQLPAPADFLLHRFLHLQLKRSKTAKCIVLAVSDSLERWKSVASKAVRQVLVIGGRSKCLTVTSPQNVNVAQNASFQFMDVFDHQPLLADREQGNADKASLRTIYDLLSVKLSDSQVEGQTPLVILDDITSLEWLGFSLLDLSRFARALRSLCAKVRRMLTLTIAALQPNIDGCSIGRPASHRYSPRARCVVAALAPVMHISHRGQTSSQWTKWCSEWRGMYLCSIFYAQKLTKTSRYACT
jgi:hypothetical protein